MTLEHIIVYSLIGAASGAIVALVANVMAIHCFRQQSKEIPIKDMGTSALVTRGEAEQYPAEVATAKISSGCLPTTPSITAVKITASKITAGSILPYSVSTSRQDT